MGIDAKCPRCGKSYFVKDEYAGRKFRCSRCEERVRVPGVRVRAGVAARGGRAASGRLAPETPLPGGSNLAPGGHRGTRREGREGLGAPGAAPDAASVAPAGIAQDDDPEPAHQAVAAEPGADPRAGREDPGETPASAPVGVSRRPRGLTVLACANVAVGLVSAGFFLYVLAQLREEGFLLALLPGSSYLSFTVASGILFPTLLGISAVGYLRKDPFLGRAVGNAFGAAGIAAAMVHGSVTGEVGMWLPRLAFPALTLVLLNTVLRDAFSRSPTRRESFILAPAGVAGAALVAMALSSWIVVPLATGAPADGAALTEQFLRSAFEEARQDPVNPRTKYQSTELHLLAAQGDLRGVEDLLRRGANIESRSWSDETTPLHQAVIAGKDEMVRLLLKRGANVNARALGGHTALWYAAEQGRVATAKILVAAGASLATTEPDFGDTLLHTAASRGQVEFAEFLISKGADVNAKNNRGATPLSHARNIPRMEACLRRHGAR